MGQKYCGGKYHGPWFMGKNIDKKSNVVLVKLFCFIWNFWVNSCTTNFWKISKCFSWLLKRVAVMIKCGQNWLVYTFAFCSFYICINTYPELRVLNDFEYWSNFRSYKIFEISSGHWMILNINILKATWNSVSVLYRTLLIYNIFCARPYSSQRPPTLFWLKAHNDPRAQLVLGTSGPEIER